MSTSPQPKADQVPLTYKFLLAFTTLSAIFFCWLYVTKPSTKVVSTPTSETSNPQQDSTTGSTTKEPTAEEQSSFASLVGSTLPGEKTETPTQIRVSQSSVPLPQSLSTAETIGWEETNDRVQHVLTAQQGDSSERLILEVPVIYQTRGLRLDTAQAKEASRILRAIKIYQGQIKKLHQDGKNIQLAWNSLLTNSQPLHSLRADSPSLPQVKNSVSLSENSAQTIQLSK